VSANRKLFAKTKLKLAYEKLFKKESGIYMEKWQIADAILRHEAASAVLGKEYCSWIIYYLTQYSYPRGADSMRVVRYALDIAPPYFEKPETSDCGMSQVEFWYLNNIEGIEESITNKVRELLEEPVKV